MPAAEVDAGTASSQPTWPTEDAGATVTVEATDKAPHEGPQEEKEARCSPPPHDRQRRTCPEVGPPEPTGKP